MLRHLRHHFIIIRFHLLLPLGLGIITSVLLIVNRNSRVDLKETSLIFGEMFLPIVMGWLAAGVLLRDPTFELLATLPHRLWRFVIERIAVLLLCGGSIWIAVLFVTYYALGQLALPLSQWARMFLTNLVSMSFFVALGCSGSLALRSWTGGILLVLLIWGAGLFLQPVWETYPLFAPFLTIFKPYSAIWPYNRLIYLFLALVLLLLGCLSIQREQILFNREGNEN